MRLVAAPCYVHFLSPLTRYSASTTPRGRWIYGAGIGALVYIIRNWGGYPDGIAFAVVLMNIAAPLIDYYTQPKVYGDPNR